MAATHHLSGGNAGPVRTQAVRPQSSAQLQRATSQPQQAYNIINGSPIAQNAPQPSSSSSNGRAHSWDRPSELTSGRASSRSAAHQRSQSVDRNYANLRNARVQQPPQSQYSEQEQAAPHQQRSASPAPHGHHHHSHQAHHHHHQHHSHAHPHGSHSGGRPASPAPAASFNPSAVQQLDSQRQVVGGGGGNNLSSSVRFSANAFNGSPGGKLHQSPEPASVRRGPPASLSRTQPLALQHSLAATARLDSPAASPSYPSSAAASPTSGSPSSSSSSSPFEAAMMIDSGSVLEVGVAEDPNPRFRPTMEDAHVVRTGDQWLEDDAATARNHGGLASPNGMGKTTKRAASLDWSSSPSATTQRKTPAKNGGNVQSGYFAVYDGHGGREAVEFIEQHLHKSVARKLRDGAHPSQALEAAFRDTDSAMQQTRRYQECGSTVASALIRPSTSRAGQRDLFVANVGMREQLSPS